MNRAKNKRSTEMKKACLAIDAAAERKAKHLKNDSCMVSGKGGKLREILQRERTMFGAECDQW